MHKPLARDKHLVDGATTFVKSPVQSAHRIARLPHQSSTPLPYREQAVANLDTRLPCTR